MAAFEPSPAWLAQISAEQALAQNDGRFIDLTTEVCEKKDAFEKKDTDAAPRKKTSMKKKEKKNYYYHRDIKRDNWWFM